MIARLAAGAFTLAASAAVADDATFTTRQLTPETALKAAQAALAKCRTDGYQVAVAVVDRAGLTQVLLRDRFAGAGGTSLRTVKRGTGEVMEVNGQPAAVYRGLDGKISVRSAVCTHMGCYVHWNNTEWTWD